MFNLFQILISDGNPELPQFFLESRSSIQDIYPDFNYVLLRDSDIRHFLRDKFPEQVLLSYLKLRPYAYKADLARYCLLYFFGGIYLDLGLRPLRRYVLPDGIDLMVIRDSTSGTPWGVLNGVIFCKPRHPVLLQAISMVVENCKNEFYGWDSLSPTGPNLFGKAVAIASDPKTSEYGFSMHLTLELKNTNRCILLPNGDIYCHFKPAPAGDLTTLGFIGTNHYAFYYYNRIVYDGTINIASS
jgi:mannosyltransferase OCH1-like enzyme